LGITGLDFTRLDDGPVMVQAYAFCPGSGIVATADGTTTGKDGQNIPHKISGVRGARAADRVRIQVGRGQGFVLASRTNEYQSQTTQRQRACDLMRVFPKSHKTNLPQKNVWYTNAD